MEKRKERKMEGSKPVVGIESTTNIRSVRTKHSETGGNLSLIGAQKVDKQLNFAACGDESASYLGPKTTWI